MRMNVSIVLVCLALPADHRWYPLHTEALWVDGSTEEDTEYTDRPMRSLYLCVGAHEF